MVTITVTVRGNGDIDHSGRFDAYTRIINEMGYTDSQVRTEYNPYSDGPVYVFAWDVKGNLASWDTPPSRDVFRKFLQENAEDPNKI